MDQEAWSNLIKLDFLTNLKMLLWKVVTFTERIKMAVLFLIFLDQICPKWIKLDQIGFPHRSKNVTIKSSHIYRKDKNGCFVFDFFGSDLSKMDQTWSNLIKLDQIGFPHQSKNVTMKSCHISRKDKNGCFVFDFFGSNLIKLDFLTNLKMLL